MKRTNIILTFVGLLALNQGVLSFRNYVSSEEPDSSEDGQAAGSATTSCACGWTNKARVVGGKETLKNEYPLMVAIANMKKGVVFCGGSILTTRHILTAAHCTEPFVVTDLAIVAGAHDMYNAGDTDVAVPVQGKAQHENYNKATYENDISILITTKPLEFNQFIGPVCMPTQRYPLINNYIKLLGWGRTSTAGSRSDVLLKVNLRVVDLKNCRDSFKDITDINVEAAKQICTFRREKDSCKGDSGGPLLWLDEATNRYTQVALVSFGLECGEDTPAINTDVFAYIDWIKLKIKESNLGVEVCQKV